jgi:hypothetical protein
VFNPAVKDYLDVCLEEMKPVSAGPPQPLSLIQALEGNPNLPFHQPPMRTTSSGVPLSNCGLPTKGSCFTEEITPEGRKITSLHPKFVKEYNKCVNDLNAGIYPKNGHMLFLKDERKKPAKAIRGINGCDFVPYCLYVQFFLPFFAAFRQARFKVGSAVGTDIAKEGFSLFNHLGQCEPEVNMKDARYITADYKNFGPTIVHQYARFIIDIIIAWYKKYGTLTENQELLMRRLWSMLVQSNHIVLDQLFIPQQGIFSGNPFTAEINTMVNNMYLRSSWLYNVYASDNEVLRADPFYWFRRLVRIVCYGDDLVARTHKALYPFFNNVTIKMFMDELGVTFTDARKRAEMVPLDDFKDVSFLKHSFVPHPTRRFCLLSSLDFQTIVDMVCYVRDRKNVLNQSVIVCQDAVRFAHGHGVSVFDDVCMKLGTALAEQGAPQTFPNWQTVDALIFDSENPSVLELVGSSTRAV